jgi:hypothetical protein
MTIPTAVPPQATRPERRGADAGFFAVIAPQTDADALDPDMAELRVVADVYTVDSSHAVDALALLRDLAGLDRHLTTGALNVRTHARFVEDRFQEADIETWLCAAGVGRLVTRLLAHRRLQPGTPQGDPRSSQASSAAGFREAGTARARRREP